MGSKSRQPTTVVASRLLDPHSHRLDQALLITSSKRYHYEGIPVYIPRSILVLLLIIYLLFLLSVDWINQSAGDWYRPFFVGFIVILVASWSHREQDSDEF